MERRFPYKRLHYDPKLIDVNVQLYNDEMDTNEALISPILELQGYFYRYDQMHELEGSIYQEENGVTITYYNYRPNRDLTFI